MISLTQLKASGVTKHSVGRAVRVGHLVAEGGGVCRMGAAPPSPRGRCWAALLRAGATDVLSHRTAAVLWALIRDWGPQLHLTSRRHRRDGHGTRLHRPR
jgi:hypothetical protein